MTANDVYEIKRKLNIDVIWQIFNEIKNTSVFGKKNKVRVSCGVTADFTRYGRNIASKNKLQKKILFDARLASALQTCIASLGFPPQELPTLVGGWHLGTCAEDDAANQVLNRYASISLSDLFFSKAVNPITLEKVDYCLICCDVFGLDNNV